MPKTHIINLLVLSSLLALASSFPTDDLVHIPFGGYQGHKWYSGYLNFTHGDYHYVFFDSQHDPDNDPVVLWLNGGPGCSSMIGMIMQNGPFVAVTDNVNLTLNKQSWNMKANMLYIQTPGGVGFSKGTRNNTYDDYSVTQDNYHALKAFFTKFPTLTKNKFFIAGQSYAGIYIPYLARKIIDMNKLPSTQIKIRLQGILVGNGCTNHRQCFEPSQFGGDGMSIYQYQFLYKHNYITDNDYLLLTGRCTLGYHSDGCKQIRDKVDKFFATTQTVINNIYQPCYHQDIPYVPKVLQSRRTKLGFKTCEDLKGIYHFFNQPQMFVHLHVDPVKFDICSDDVANKYTMFEDASQHLYPQLIKDGLRIWIYSGDIDANVPTLGTLNWIHLMKDLEGLYILEPWRQWWVPGQHKHEDQTAGMVWKLKGLTFVSVKGAGHMVPHDKRKEASVMFHAFIKNHDLPYKDE